MPEEFKKINQKFVIIITLFLISLIFIIFQFVVYIKQDKNFTNYIKKQNIVYTSGKTIFFGDSITYGYDLEKYFHNENYINKGVNANTTLDLIDRIDKDIIDYNPSNIVMLIGTNDYSVGKIEKEETIENIENIISIIRTNLPNTKLYIESIYPVDEDKTKERYNKDYEYINENIKKLCDEIDKVYYIDLYSDLLKDGKLNNRYSSDGLHLNDKGYIVVTNKINKYLEK